MLPGFAIVAISAEPLRGLSADARRIWRAIGGEQIAIGDTAGCDGEDAQHLVETDSLFQELLRTNNLSAVIVRPDRYIFGGAKDVEDLDSLIRSSVQDWPCVMIPATETCVLIVGGGPVGLTAAIELAWRGIPAILVTENHATTQHPKCNTTNARSMEHYRRLGIARDLRAAGLPPHIVRASAYVTRFCGYEFGRLPRPYSGWPTSEIANNVSQIVLEQKLRAHAERQPGLGVHFGWKLASFESGRACIHATIESEDGNRRQITARYMIGADGAASLVRRTLGIGMIGEDGTTQRAFMGGTMLSYYIRSSELLARSARVPTHSTWIINPEMRSLMFSQDGKEHWVAHYQVPPDVDWRALDPQDIIRGMLGFDVAFEIISGGPWTGGLALVAEHYCAGNVFLVGDAAHLFTPLGGMGMNTGIGDVMNVAWKIAAVVEGWGGPNLLPSYEVERRPIGVRNSQFGVKCSRVMDGWIVPKNLEDDTPDAQAARETLGAQIVVEDVPQYLSTGLQLGERYKTSPIICADATSEPPDTWDVYTPACESSARRRRRNCPLSSRG